MLTTRDASFHTWLQRLEDGSTTINGMTAEVSKYAITAVGRQRDR
jgi:hypothetical protein